MLAGLALSVERLAQLALRALLLGEVVHHALQQHGALLVDDLGVVADPHDLAVAGDHPVLEQDALAAVDVPVLLAQDAVAVDGVQALLPQAR